MKKEITKELKFIKGFSKISISGICKKVNVNRSNLLNGTAGDDREKIVKEEIERELAKLYL
jgi:hypothetical protein